MSDSNPSVLIDLLGTSFSLMIGLIILSKMQRAINTPRTPYRLKKIIKSLESELITRTLITKEEIIIP